MAQARRRWLRGNRGARHRMRRTAAVGRLGGGARHPPGSRSTLTGRGAPTPTVTPRTCGAPKANDRRVSTRATRSRWPGASTTERPPPAPRATHAFSAPGTHTATATATDSAGVTTIQAITVDGRLDVPVDVPDTKAPRTEIIKHPKARRETQGGVRVLLERSRAAPSNARSTRARPRHALALPVKVKARRKPHSFSVVAVDAAGNRDSTPATYSWKVKRKRR